MRTLMRALVRIDTALFKQRGHLFPWAPVAMAIGIGTYFGLSSEPVLAIYPIICIGALLVGLVTWRFPGSWSPFGWGICLIALGFCIAGARAHMVSAPVMKWRYYGAVEGRVVALDRSASDAVRVTLDDVRLENFPAKALPERLRLSLHGPEADLQPGQRIMTTAHMSPPQGPVEPGGFDFRRHAWFQRLGGVGYTRVPVLTIAPPEKGIAGLRIFALRMAISSHVREVLPGDTGGFAAAVTTGDRSGVHQATLDALRISNLAHLLAISGLHMGLLSGFVFGSLRLGLAAIPPLALRWPVRKIAAIGALIAATGYLALSGGNVATERAYVMAAVILFAVLVDRRAFSLRAVALAALIVLTLRPEALLGPGFQMSFAATTALVGVFGAIRDADLPRLPGWARPVIGVLLSSAIAGAATAPIGAAHFNSLSHYGLIANLVSVPVMGTLVVPAAVLAFLLTPLGLDWIGIWAMGIGLDWILGVAQWVSALSGAQSFVPRPDPVVLPMLVLGLLFVILWQGRLRLVGFAPAALALIIWGQAERPAVLVADTGSIVGVMTSEGRALSKPRGSGFIALNWLENDGDGANQAKAAERWPVQNGRLRFIAFQNGEIVHVNGKRAAAEFKLCRPDQIVISSVKLQIDGGCRIYDPDHLEETGSLAISGDKTISAREVSGGRIWNTTPASR